MASNAGTKRKNSFTDEKVKQPKQTNLTDLVHSQQNRRSSTLLSSLHHIRIFAMRRPKPECITKENWLVYNVTSTTREKWCLEFSPFVLGPIELYPNPKDGTMLVAKNMENAWQFCKVYQQHAETDDQSPSSAYWQWAGDGWNDSKPHRFPLGRKASKPLYSLWNGKRLNYIEARKTIYAPLYAKYVEQTDAYKKLNDIYLKYCCGDVSDKQQRPIALTDFDGWDYLGQGYTLEDVIDLPKPKMGHAFVLAGLLENNLFWLAEPEKSRVEELRRNSQLLKDIS
ncbi:unnamed protein product [Adineta ricciae]|uniref:Uncharacterized protein n=1 Tax=Adineta ricciae TaxID=249248 RepID=A0A814YBE1_ADIRI|nr:unnamed protein product [Adineta ricciae]